MNIINVLVLIIFINSIAIAEPSEGEKSNCMKLLNTNQQYQSIEINGGLADDQRRDLSAAIDLLKKFRIITFAGEYLDIVEGENSMEMNTTPVRLPPVDMTPLNMFTLFPQPSFIPNRPYNRERVNSWLSESEIDAIRKAYLARDEDGSQKIKSDLLASAIKHPVFQTLILRQLEFLEKKYGSIDQDSVGGKKSAQYKEIVYRHSESFGIGAFANPEELVQLQPFQKKNEIWSAERNFLESLTYIMALSINDNSPHPIFQFLASQDQITLSNKELFTLVFKKALDIMKNQYFQASKMQRIAFTINTNSPAAKAISMAMKEVKKDIKKAQW